MKNHLGYGLLTLIARLIGIIIIQVLLTMAKPKKINEDKSRTIICYGGLLSLLFMILSLTVFTPPLSFSLIGGILSVAILLIVHISSLAIDKNKYIEKYKF